MAAVKRRWLHLPVDTEAADALARACKITPRLARLLLRRGIDSPEAYARFSQPRLAQLPHPFTMKHAQRAAERLADAIQGREAIAIYGDYDVDGVTSSALLVDFVRAHGHDARVYIPRRLAEGYGLNPEAVDTVAGWGTQLLITVDCGITAAGEIARANEHGIQTIVVDHHHCPPELPPAYATLNPQQEDCGYPDKGLAAVGVCLNLIIATRIVLRERGAYAGQQEPNLKARLDLVAMGTVADLVPLTGVNRVLTHIGLGTLRGGRRDGLRALMQEAGVAVERASAADIGYRLAPRVNAAGRLEDAAVGVRLMLSQDLEQARQLAASLSSVNDRRKSIQERVFKEAVERIDAAGGPPEVIVLADPSWHPGVVGIVCSMLVERYDRPTLLIGEGGRGSARTARGLNLHNVISDCADHLIKFGGHKAAAGFRIASAEVDRFRDALTARVQSEELGETVAEYSYDEEVDPKELDWPLFKELNQLRPYGMKNDEPVLMVPNTKVMEVKVMRGDHLKLRLRAGRYDSLWAILFGGADRADGLRAGSEISVLGFLMENHYKGHCSLELRLRDLRPEA